MSKTITVPWTIDQTALPAPEGFLFLHLTDPDGSWKASVKRDGCVDLTRIYPGNHDDNEDYLHICDVNDLIERLQALKVMAASHFGEWPE